MHIFHVTVSYNTVMATLIGTCDKQSSSADINLSVSDIYMQTKGGMHHTITELTEYVKVDIVFHFMRNNEPNSLHFDMNIPEPAGQDSPKADLEHLVSTARKVAHSKRKTHIITFQDFGYELFEVEFYPEPGLDNRVDISVAGTFGVDDELVLRLYPTNDNLIAFADQLEQELVDVIEQSRKKYADRIS